VSAKPVEPITASPPQRLSKPFMRQTWRDLTFLHWPYSPEIVRRLVPAPFELDLYEGSAWVGLVPFVITGLTRPRAPAIPWLSSFPETNVRTYVIDPEGNRGVWFFSLDAARLAAVIGARLGYALPYFWNRMSVMCESVSEDAAPPGVSLRYQSVRLFGPKASSDITIHTGDPIPSPSELELFLTARFRLFALRGGRIMKAAIEHPQWPLQRATVLSLKQDLMQAAGLPDPSGEPLAHFAREINVLVGSPRY
jgi:uncharacterized protein YqjF (DUF2071 family)